MLVWLGLAGCAQVAAGCSARPLLVLLVLVTWGTAALLRSLTPLVTDGLVKKRLAARRAHCKQLCALASGGSLSPRLLGRHRRRRAPLALAGLPAAARSLLLLLLPRLPPLRCGCGWHGVAGGCAAAYCCCCYCCCCWKYESYWDWLCPPRPAPAARSSSLGGAKESWDSPANACRSGRVSAQ